MYQVCFYFNSDDMVKYIVSKYTNLFTSSKNEGFVYCSRTNAFCKISEKLYPLLVACKKDPELINSIDSVSMDTLIRNKILVKQEDDENYVLKRWYETNVRTFDNSLLTLTLVPTLDCNFDCPYCFEHSKRSLTMKDYIIENLIEFIKSRPNSKHLGICWYGGEPLLALDVMEKIMQRIKDEVQIPIGKHIVITNGSLINEKAIKFFKDYKVDSIQITFDGTKQRHDQIRKNKNSKEPTFDLLVQNITQLSKELPLMNIDIRVNIEKANQDDFFQMLDFAKNQWNNERIRVYPGFLRIDDKTGKAMSCASFNKSEIANFMLDLSKREVDRVFYPTLVKTICMASRTNAYIIGPEGEIYKCWNDVSDSTKVVGNICNNELSNPHLYYKYVVGTQWYNRESCKKCFFLPICDNGCAWYILRNEDEGGRFELCNCLQKIPGMLNKCLQNYFEQKQTIKYTLK